MKLSVYDLDHTFCIKSTIKLFYKYLLGKNIISPLIAFRINLIYLLFILKIASLKTMREATLCALSHKDKDEIEKIATGFITELKVSDFREELLSSINSEINQGYFLILLTGAPDLYACKIGEKFKFNKVISTKTEFIQNKFTGRTLGKNFKGQEKLRVLEEFIAQGDFDLSASRGYGNQDDVPWLKLFENSKMYKQI